MSVKQSAPVVVAITPHSPAAKSGLQPGDEVILKEWDPREVEKSFDTPMWRDRWVEPKGYTGRELTFKIGYVLPIDDKRVVFSLLSAECGK